MATWEQPPRDAYTLLIEYMNQAYPEGYSAACDMGKRLIQLDVPSLDDSQMGLLIVDLKTRYPGAF